MSYVVCLKGCTLTVFHSFGPDIYIYLAWEWKRNTKWKPDSTEICAPFTDILLFTLLKCTSVEPFRFMAIRKLERFECMFVVFDVDLHTRFRGRTHYEFFKHFLARKPNHITILNTVSRNYKLLCEL